LPTNGNIGFADIIHLPTIGDVKKFCGYLGKNFDKPKHQRPHNHRYIPAPNYAPKWIDFGQATRADGEILAQRLAGGNWAQVERWEYHSDWCTGGFEWNLDDPCGGGLVEDETEFLKRLGVDECH
jgi:hypothetical protein